MRVQGWPGRSEVCEATSAGDAAAAAIFCLLPSSCFSWVLYMSPEAFVGGRGEWLSAVVGPWGRGSEKTQGRTRGDAVCRWSKRGRRDPRSEWGERMCRL